jgi:hypothetical protein
VLVDLFSHKIHATDDLEAWGKKLVKLATIFNQFDGQVFDREAFDRALKILSPEAARSPFRDTYSIYMSIFGIGRISWEDRRWVCRISETARAFLLGIEPDVEAFCRLQLALYQRPDGRGLLYSPSGPALEHQSRGLTLNLIHNGYRVCPFRFILKIFKAKAQLDEEDEDNVVVRPEEVYALTNTPSTRHSPSPPLDALISRLQDLRAGRIPAPAIQRKTFKFLEITNLLSCDARDNLRLKPFASEIQRIARNQQIDAIRNLEIFFDGFNHATNYEELRAELNTGLWGQYFDAIQTIPSEPLAIIAGQTLEGRLASGAYVAATNTLPLVESEAPSPAATLIAPPGLRPEPRRGSTRPIADPEETRIKRERRNSYHDLLLRLIAERIERRGLEAKQTSYIDLFTNVENVADVFGEDFNIDGSYLQDQALPYFPAVFEPKVSFLFEVKSSDDTILIDQVRKAVSQLYEYRYRYKRRPLNRHVILVIALQSAPSRYPWVIDYLLRDRHIGICWLKGNDQLACPPECLPVLRAFVDGAA